MSFICETCNVNFSTRQRFATHTESEKHKNIFKIYETLKNKYENEIKILENKLNIENQEKKELKLLQFFYSFLIIRFNITNIL